MNVKTSVSVTLGVSLVSSVSIILVSERLGMVMVKLGDCKESRIISE